MRIAKCKYVCREIEEADHGQRLSASVTDHLAGCPRCQSFHDERTRLLQLIASLETVAAPPDFDLRVRSRLANEKAGAHAGYFFSNLSFGFPSVALATLVLMVGGFFALRAWNASTNSTTEVQTASRDANPPNKSDQSVIAGKSELRESEVTLPDNKSAPVATKGERRETPGPVQRIAKRRSVNSTVAGVRSRKHVATKEFSSSPAPVVKQEAVASLETFPIIPIEASSQPLRLSLDYSGGVSRTISVPALSFGSERAVVGDGLSLVKNSPKGAW